MVSFIEYVKINIKKLSIKKIVICTLIETSILLMLGMILYVSNANIRLYIPDYIFIIVTVETFEMVSAIERTIKEKNLIFFEMLFWLKFTIFSLISFIYIFIILQIPLFEGNLLLFNNLKFTTLITMILMIGFDSVLDQIYDDDTYE